MEARICTKCGQEKPTSEFYRRSDRASGYKSECKDCTNGYDRVVNKEAQSLRARKSWLKTKYNMTLDEYDELFERQGGCCAICNTHIDEAILVSERHFCVDHNHDTGEVRGLLCLLCNSMLGKANDNADVLLAGALYLKQRGSYAKSTP